MSKLPDFAFRRTTDDEIEMYHKGISEGWKEGIQQGIAIGMMATVVIAVALLAVLPHP